MAKSVTKSSKFRVLGIDPGLNVTGYGAIEMNRAGPEIIEAGTLRTDPNAETSHRIAQIYDDLSELLADMRPDLVAIEKLYAHYKHPRTAILMAHARGVVLLAAQRAGVAVRNLAATKVKKSLTGNGHASKRQVQRAIQTVCNLDKLPEPADVADAIAIALCAARSR